MRRRLTALRRYIIRQGYPFVITSTRRSRAKQAACYLDWVEGRSQFPAARPGRSMHERGLAFDAWSTPAGLQLAGDVAPYFELAHSPNDPVHFQAAGYGIEDRP